MLFYKYPPGRFQILLWQQSSNRARKILESKAGSRGNRCGATRRNGKARTSQLSWPWLALETWVQSNPNSLSLTQLCQGIWDNSPSRPLSFHLSLFPETKKRSGQKLLGWYSPKLQSLADQEVVSPTICLKGASGEWAGLPSWHCRRRKFHAFAGFYWKIIWSGSRTYFQS